MRTPRELPILIIEAFNRLLIQLTASTWVQITRMQKHPQAQSNHIRPIREIRVRF
jgi:hypothetical protein